LSSIWEAAPAAQEQAYRSTQFRDKMATPSKSR
jgi:hypothetical protein